MGNEWGVTLTTDSYMIPMYGLAEALFKKWQLDEDPGLLSDLLCGDESLLSVEIILSAVRLAEHVRNDDELRVFRELLNNAVELGNIRIIQRRIHFVEDTEGCGLK